MLTSTLQTLFVLIYQAKPGESIKNKNLIIISHIYADTFDTQFLQHELLPQWSPLAFNYLI